MTWSSVLAGVTRGLRSAQDQGARAIIFGAAEPPAPRTRSRSPASTPVVRRDVGRDERGYGRVLLNASMT